MTNLQAIFFDLNGVLIDDEALHELAFRTALEQYDLNLTHDAYALCFSGRTDKAGFDEYSIRTGIKFPDIEGLIDHKRSIYESMFDNEVAIYPQVVEFLKKSFLSDAKIAIVTGAPLREVEMTLNKLENKYIPDLIISADDVETGKPDPEGYLLAAKILGLAPGQCVAIEDSPSGVKAAKQAGMRCIAVTNTHSIEQLHEADRVISSFDEIELFDDLEPELGIRQRISESAPL